MSQNNKLTREAKIGRKMVAVAVLDVTSVNVVIITQTRITIAYGGIVLRLASCVPTHLDNPETCNLQSYALVKI